jgi:hypothetical protein
MRRRAILIILLMLLCYSYAPPRWADWSQTSRLALVRAMVERRTLRIDAYVESTGDYALIDGHAYSDKAPGPALLAAPLYALIWQIQQWGPIQGLLERLARRAALAGTVRSDGAGLSVDRVGLAFSHYLLTLAIVALPAALAVAALDWLLRRWFQPGPALLGALSYGAATPAAVYAGNFYSHALVAALLIGAWALIERAGDAPQQRGRWLIGAGLLLGWSAISEYPALLIGGALGLYALRRCGAAAIGWLALGGAPALVALAGYDWLAFGTLWPIGYAHSALWQEQHQSGFVSLTYPHPAALWGLLGGGFRGLFVRAPWLLLALPGLISWARSGWRRDLLVLVGAASLSLWLVYGSSRMWWGGFAAGPRYLVPILPFVAVAATYWIDRRWRQPGWRWLAIGLAALSLLLVWAEALAGQQFPPDNLRQPWTMWTLPAWQRSDVARNLGMALGLRGGLSLLPLVIVAAGLGALLLRTPRRHTQRSSAQPLPMTR